MDLMEILKVLFGGEALTFEQFAEKVNNAADVKLGNLAGGQYVEKDKYDDVSNQLASRSEERRVGNSNLRTLFYKLQSAVLLLLEGLLFTQNFMGCRLFTTFLTAVTYKYLLQ